MIGVRSAAALRALARRIGELEVRVESSFALASSVRALDYPGGWRPSGLLLLGGHGVVGRGELVAFEDAEQERCARELPAEWAGRRGPVAALMSKVARDSEAARWRRAAVEGALIDLALRQAGRSLSELAAPAGPAEGSDELALRCLVSFDACADPAARLRSLGAAFPSARFKVDVDPAWSDQAMRALADTEAVAVLDFKGRGDATAARRLARLFDEALLEDPPDGAALPAHRVARDRPVTDLAAAACVVSAGEALNLKAPRMGGFLEALEAAALARDAGTPLYVGGMFEVDVGRRQARALAAVVAPEAEHDLAPLRGVEPLTPVAVHLGRRGWGR